MTTSADVPRSATLLPSSLPAAGEGSTSRAPRSWTTTRRSDAAAAFAASSGERCSERTGWSCPGCCELRARWLTRSRSSGPRTGSSRPSAPSPAPSSTDAGRGAVSYGAQSSTPSSSRTAPAPFPAAKDLVVVCGHAVFVGGDFSDAAAAEEARLVPGAVPTRARGGAGHAHEGWGGVGKRARSLASDLLRRHDSRARGVADARRRVTQRAVSRASGGSAPGERHRDARVHGGTRARLAARTCFSRSRGSRELTGSVPRHLTVVPYAFKRDRFEREHVPAPRWPERASRRTRGRRRRARRGKRRPASAGGACAGVRAGPVRLRCGSAATRVARSVRGRGDEPPVRGD